MNAPMGTTSCVMCGKETTWEVLPDWWHEQNMRLPRYCSLECFRAAIASIKASIKTSMVGSIDRTSFRVAIASIKTRSREVKERKKKENDAT